MTNIKEMNRVLLALSLILVAAWTVPASAQQTCLQLEAQLAALKQQNRAAAYQALYEQYQRAEQNYSALYNQADRAGCIPRLLRPQVPASCNGIRVQLEQLYAQLEQLQSQLRAADPSQTAARRNSILRSLAANNCGPQYAGAAANQGGVQLGNGGLLGRIFGNGPNITEVPQENYQPLVTTYRTLCVRSCDGYYFPISFSTTPSQFGADQQTCQAQCPGASLYYHRNPGEPVDAAISLNGQAYTALANAFAYRTDFFPECRCQSASFIAAEDLAPVSAAEVNAITLIAANIPAVPLPRVRPEPSEDPDTIANRFGGFEPGAYNIGVGNPGATVMVDDDGTRLIGPAYLYAQ